MKRLLCTLIALILMLSMASFAVAEDEVVDIWVFNNGGGVTNGVASDPEILKTLQDWFVEKIGVRINVIVPPAEEVKTKLNLLLTSGDQIDAFWGNWQEYSALGMIQPITDLYSAEKYPGIAQEFGFALDQMTDGDGELWGLPRTFGTAPYPYLYRSDWAEAVGITEKPVTMDDLNALLYAVKEADPAGNGQTIPLVATDIANMLQCILGLYTEEGYAEWLDEESGKVKMWISQPGVEDAVAQIAQWYADGILYKDFATLDTSSLRELATTGRAFSSLQWYSAISMAWQNMYLADKSTPAQGEFSFLATEDGKTGSNFVPGSTSGLVFSANASTEAIEAILKVVDFQLSDPEARFNATYGVDAWEYGEGSTQVAVAKEQVNTGSAGYNTEYRLSIGQLRISEFKELLSLNDDRYVASNGEQAGYFFYYLYMDHLYDVDAYRPELFDYTFDTAKISEDVIAYTDVNTMIEEELYKFVSGARAIDEWDGFIEQLYSIGMGEVEDALTEQYNEMI